MKQLSLFQLLAAGLETVIRNGNPWWHGEPIAELPPFRRWAFEPVYRRLTRGLAPAIVLRGPRQIGKTTLLTQVVLPLGDRSGCRTFSRAKAEPEVDFILTVGEQRVPVEVKYRRRIDHRDTLGLRSFIEKAHYNAPFGVLVTMADGPGTEGPRIVSLPLSTLHLLR